MPVPKKSGNLLKVPRKRTCGDYPDYSMIKIGQNTEKSQGDLMRLAFT